ncbi:MAG TPA: nuclear transport factor 2 family protein [Anditalea sp.]|nr:nuclear transport factor 2 family protein [Anditalea sp.]
MNNLDTVNQIYNAFGKGDIQTILECLADNVKWEQWSDNSAQKAGVPWMQARQGKEGALEFFKIVSEFNVKDFQLLSIMGNETQVAVEIIFEANIPSTNGHYRDEEIHLWTFNDEGQVVRMRHYTDTHKHIAAATQK